MTEPVILALIPTVGTIITVWLQTGSKRKMEEFREKLETLQVTVDNITAIGKKNNEDIGKVANATKTTESYRLEIDLTQAVERGYRTREESRRIEPLYQSYKELGGNGYIEDLHNQFVKLPIKTEE